MKTRVAFFILLFASLSMMQGWAQVTIWQQGNGNISTSCGTVNAGRAVSLFGNTSPIFPYSTSWAGESISYVQVDNGWGGGSGTKGWKITVNTTAFQNMSVSFKPMSYNRNMQDFGPRDWKMQYSLDNSTWTDVGVGYSVQDLWSSGTMTRTLPAACNNQSAVHLRWIMTSNVATDGNTIRGTGTGPASAIGNIKVTGSEIPMAPTDISLSANQVNGIGVIGRVVGSLSATDPNECGGSFTYSLVAGTGDTDNSNYQITGNTLKVKVTNLTGATNSVRINVNDGSLNYTKIFTINVTQPSAPTDIQLTASSIHSVAAIGTVVGTLSAVDADAGETYTYSLVTGEGSTHNNYYEIAGNQLKVKISPLTGSTNTVRINVNDGMYNFSKSFNINIEKYCTSWADFNDYNYFTNVSFNTIDNTTGKETAAYGNYLNITTNINKGGSYDLSLTHVDEINDSGLLYHIMAWIDWNQNGNFDDSGEGYEICTNQYGTQTFETSITVPSDALAGLTRMRIATRLPYGIYPEEPALFPPSCGLFDYGEVEDYSLNIIASNPTVSSVAVPANATYKAGQNLDFTVNYSEAVTVNTTGGTPYIPLTLNTGGTVHANYVSGSGTTALVFRYTVAVGNLDNDGITVGALALNGGTIKNGSSADANLTLNSVGSTSGVKVDAIIPTATIVIADNALVVGETSLVTITFSEAVTGFTNVDLSIANGTLTAVSSSDGGVTWTTTFTPTGSIEDPTNGITLSNTGILDASGNTGSGTTDSNNYSIDTKRPTATVTISDNALIAGETSLVSITFSEAVTGFTNADLTIAHGSLTAVSSSDGGVTWIATFTPTASIEDPTNVITLSNTGILDAAGNTGSGTTDSNNYSIDTKRPTIASVDSGIANGSYKTGDVISITTIFSEAVNVTGTPTLTLNSGGTATYLSGSLTNVLTFNYTVANGDGSVDLDYFSINALLLSGGTIKDAQGNDATLTLPTVGGANSLGGQKNIIIVMNPGTGGTITANQTGCYPFNPGEITSSALPTGHIGTLEYKWQYSTTGSSSGFSDLANSNTPAYDPGLLTVDTWFKRIVRVNEMDTWVDAATSNVVKITVLALPSQPTAGSNSHTFDGTVKTAIANVGVGETIDWYANATGNTPATAPTSTNVGTYSAYAEARNTTSGCVSENRTLITLEITKAPLIVTADAKTKVYGAANPTLTFSYSGWKNGDDENDLTTKPSTSTSVDLLTGVGVHAGAITIAGGADENYAFTYVPANFEVTKAMLTVTADAKTKVYGQSNPALTFTYSGWQNGDDEKDLTIKPAASTTVSATSPVGLYNNAIILTGGVDENYAFNYIPADLEVTKAMLTVTADAKTKIYGLINPTLTFTYSGWQNGDDENDLATKPAASTTIDLLTGVGTYPGAISLSGGVDDNYAFTYIPADFVVTKATLTVTADAKTKIYGLINPTLTFTYSGWLNGDDENDLATKSAASTTIDLLTGVGTYPGAITLAGGVDENYDFTYVPANFEVTKATLTVTADAKTKVYGQSNPALKFTYSGWQNGDDENDLTTKPAASTTVSATSPVGLYNNAITLSGGVDENYAFTYIPADFEVAKAILTLTADAKTKVYGQSNPTVTFNYSGWQNGDDENDLTTKPVASTTVAVASPVGIYNNAITLSGGVDENYAFTYVPANFEVTKAMLTVTADTKTKVYGDANPSLTFSYSGWQNGDDENDLTTKPAASTSVDLLTGVGVHAGAITIAGGADENYAFTYVPANFEVTKAMLTVTADPKTKVYGQSNPSLTFNYSGWQNGDDENDLTTKPVASTAVAVTSTVGLYDNAITLSGGVDENYAFAYVPANFEVTKAMLTVTADSKTKVYGQANPELTFQYIGWQNGDGENDLTTKPAVSTTVNLLTGAGTYPGAITLAGAMDENYTFTYIPANVEITKAMVTVTSDAKTKVYGQSNPTLTFNYSGWQNGDDENDLTTKPAASTSVAVASPVGIYNNAITLSGAVDENYTFTYIPANFEVTKALLTVTADTKTKVYGQANPELTFQYSGWQNGDDENDLTSKPSAATTVSATSPAGIYNNAITLSGAVDENYTFTYVPTNFEVTKAMLTVTADAKTKVYGAANPTLTFSYSGWQNGDDENDLATKPVASTTVDLFSGAGNHSGAITLSGAVDENYDFTYVFANLEVTKAMLTVTADAKTKAYGQANPELTFQYSGWKNGDTEPLLDIKPTASTSVNMLTGVGIHKGAITLSGGVDNNYNFTYRTADFEITKAMLTINANAKTKNYGDAIPTLTFDYSGWKNGDDENDLATKPIASTTASVNSPVGLYPITLSEGEDENYNFTYYPASMEVTKAVLYFTADAQTKVYGHSNPTLSYNYSGWQNGDDIEDLTTPPVAVTSVSTNSPVGTYPKAITFSKGEDENYDFKFIPADFTISRAPLNIIADNKTKCYDDKTYEGEFSVTYDGFVNGEDKTVLGGNLQFSKDALEATTPGNYVIHPSGLVSNNYEISYLNGILNIDTLPIPEISGSTSVCVGSTVTYRTDASMVGYVWTISETGVIISGQGTSEISVKWNTTGENTITLTYSNSSGCTSTSTKNVYVNPLPTASMSGDATVCSGSVNLIGIHFTGQAPWSVTYTDGTHSQTVSEIWESDFSFTVNLAANTSKTYTITEVTDANGCSNASVGGFVIKVKSATLPGSIGADQFIAAGTTPALIISKTPGSGDGKISYVWEISSDNGLNWSTIPGENGDSFAPGRQDQPAWYRRIALAAEDSIICTAATEPVKINLFPTSAGDLNTSSILKAYAIKNTKILINGEVSEKAIATLFDIQGRMILSKNLVKGSLNEIPTPGLKSGIYLLVVKDSEKINSFKIPLKE